MLPSVSVVNHFEVKTTCIVHIFMVKNTGDALSSILRFVKAGTLANFNLIPTKKCNPPPILPTIQVHSLILPVKFQNIIDQMGNYIF